MPTEPTGYWTFFCNPAKWEIDEFLLRQDEIDEYTITDWQKDWFKPGQFGLIRVGVDRRSKSQLRGKSRLKPGIYGVVEVLSAPVHPERDDPFWLEPPSSDRLVVQIRYIENLLDNPVLLAELKALPDELDPHLIGGFQASTMPLEPDTYQRVVALVKARAGERNDNPPNTEFTVGQEYRRSDLHGQYGGSRFGGISPLARYPMVLLFSGEPGHQYGYQDGFQPDGTFWYTGEGQVGDMVMTKGNRAILESGSNGKELHIFESTKPGFVTYLGKAEYLDHHMTPAVDRDGNTRQAIIFEFGLVGSDSHAILSVSPKKPTRHETRLWTRPLDDLRKDAIQEAPREASVTERKTITRKRSEAVRVYVQRRANGVCEGCGNVAPFTRPDGTPYLEPHHITRLADQGPDHPRWVAALCPNCHRRVHYGVGGKEFNQIIADRLAEIEPG